MKTTTMQDFDINADYKRRLAKMREEIDKRDLLIGDLGEQLGKHKRWIGEAERALESAQSFIDKQIGIQRTMEQVSIRQVLQNSPCQP